MPEAQPPPPPGEVTLPTGPGRYAWFAGILEGRVADRRAVEQIFEQLRASNTAPAELEFEGDRFSLLLDERTIPGERAGAEQRQQLADLLGQLVRTSAEPQTVESTLRCTEVHDDVVVETMFAPLRGVVGQVSRVRAVGPEDRRRDPAAAVPTSGFSPSRIALIAALMATAFAFLVWQAGVLDRLWSAPAAELAVETGRFAGLLDASVEEDYGNYRVIVRRGAGYPASGEAVAALEAAAESTADRAAVVAVANGDVIHVHLQDEAGEVLQFAAIGLRALLLSEEATVEARIPGRIEARVVRLTLAPGR